MPSLDAGGADARVWIGSNNEWAWAIERFTARGSAPETLCRLSTQSDAVSIALTQTVSALLYAANGVLVSGFDLDLPHIRYGSDHHRFDAPIAEAGFLDAAVPDAPAQGALFLRIVFGLTITPELLAETSMSAALL